MSAHRTRTIRLRILGTRPLPVALAGGALLAALVALPHLLVRPLPPARAAELVRQVRSREVSAAYGAYYESKRPGPTDPTARAYTDSLAAARERRFASIRVRTSLMVPPFARHVRYLVEVRERPGGEAEYYAVRNGDATRSSRLGWRLRLF